MPEDLQDKSKEMEQGISDNNSLSQEYLLLKSQYEKLISEKNQKQEDNFVQLNNFSNKIAGLSYQDVFYFMVNHIKDYFNVKVAWILIFDEVTSSFIIKYSSLSSELNTRFAKLLGRKAMNYGIQVTPEHYNLIVNEKYHIFNSLNELSFGAIPEIISSTAKELMEVNWFSGTALMDNGKLIGSLVLGGNSSQISPDKETLLAFAGIAVHAFGRKKAEMELLQVRIRNKALLKAMPDLILIQNSKGIYIDCHVPESFAHIASAELFVGKSINEIFPVEQLKVLKPVFRKAVKTKEVQVLEYSQLLPDGVHDYEARIIAFSEDNILSIIRDVSDKIQAGKALSKSEEKYRTMVQYSSDPIFSFNPDESYRFVNENFARAFGKRPEEIIGKTPHEIFSFEEAEKRLSLVRKVFKSGEKGEIEVKVVSPDGSINYYITIVDPIKDETGKILWVSCISKNITERMLAELKIKKQNEELTELIRTKDKFFSIIAHDLKNPFNSLLGLSELLLENFEVYKKEKIKEFVNDIAITSNQAYKLLENLLEWSGIQQGILKPLFKKENLKTIAGELEMLKTGIAKNKSIRLDNSIKHDIFVNCDLEMTKTVLRNLVSNAIKYTNSNGKISISVECSNLEAIISVKDNGVGIPSDKIEKLFQIDTNISTKGTSGESGTGLGLLLCKELVEMQGGRFWLESEVEKGSIFSFSLQLYQDVN